MVLSEGLKKVHPYHALEVVRYSGGGGGVVKWVPARSIVFQCTPGPSCSRRLLFVEQLHL